VRADPDATLEAGFAHIRERLDVPDRVGQEFDVVIVAVDDDGDATVQMGTPAVMARIPDAGLEPGSEAVVRLDAVDLTAGAVELSVVGPER